MNNIDSAGTTNPAAASRRVLASNLGWATILQFGVLAIQFAQLPYLARVLGLDGFGRYALIGSIAQTCGLLVDFGLAILLPKLAAESVDDTGRLSALLGASLLLKAIWFSFCVLLVTGILIFVATPLIDLRPMLLALFAAFLAALVPVWLFQGLQRFGTLSILSIVCHAGALTLTFAFVRREDDLALIFAIQCVAWISLLAFALRSLRHSGIVPALPSRSLLHKLGRQSLDYFGSRVAASLYTTLPTVLVSMSGNTAQIALFSAAEKILRAMQMLAYPLIDAMYPWMVRFRDTSFFVRVAGAFIATMALGALLIALFAAEVLAVSFGRGYEQGALLLQVLMIVVPINAGAMIMGYPFLEAFGRGSAANRSVQIGAVFFACAFPVIVTVGSVSALVVAFLILATEAVVLAIRTRVVLEIFGRFRIVGRE